MSLSMENIVDGVINLIKQNIISRTNVVSDVLTGDILVNVENTLHFEPNQEIVLIDYGYNDKSSPHYQKYEYGVIKEINNTHYITLTSKVESDWLISNDAFIQKAIAHSPLYEDNVFYNDRAVIPTNDMAVCIEPVSDSNDWIYIQGGLSTEFLLDIIVYSHDISTENGGRILSRYVTAINTLLNKSIHTDINNYETPLMQDVNNLDTYLIIEDSIENREEFTVQVSPLTTGRLYSIQDNLGVTCYVYITNVEFGVPDIGLIKVTIAPLSGNFKLEEYAVLRKEKFYIYDSRSTNTTYGQIQKGSAFIRAAVIKWFGKAVEEFPFPQVSLGVPYFKQIEPPLPVSSSSSSLSSESSASSSSSSS